MRPSGTAPSQADRHTSTRIIYLQRGLTVHPGGGSRFAAPPGPGAPTYPAPPMPTRPTPQGGPDRNGAQRGGGRGTLHHTLALHSAPSHHETRHTPTSRTVKSHFHTQEGIQGPDVKSHWMPYPHSLRLEESMERAKGKGAARPLPRVYQSWKESEGGIK